jgi:hypothetical protein
VGRAFGFLGCQTQILVMIRDYRDPLPDSEIDWSLGQDPEA